VCISHLPVEVDTIVLIIYNRMQVKSILKLFIMSMALEQAYASCFCSPLNGCKCACEHNDIVPDSEWSWHGSGQDGYLGNFGCGPDEGYHVASDENLGGGAFGWRCLYIKCD
jgi:hypothetical protein